MIYIDDDLFNHICLKNTIKSFNNKINVISMFSGNDAIEYIKKEGINCADCILTDLNMPLLNGI
jgi:CheY-like chemotaxis protein